MRFYRYPLGQGSRTPVPCCQTTIWRTTSPRVEWKECYSLSFITLHGWNFLFFYEYEITRVLVHSSLKSNIWPLRTYIELASLSFLGLNYQPLNPTGILTGDSNKILRLETTSRSFWWKQINRLRGTKKERKASYYGSLA